MAFIQNETARKSTFKKRKGGLLKKAHELATLCDVPVGVIVGSPLDPSPPEVFPSREGMNKIIYDMQKMSVVDKTKKMVNHETYLIQRVNKSSDSCKKLYRESREVEMKEAMFNCLSGKTLVSHVGKSNLGDLCGIIDQYLKDLNRMKEILNRDDESSSSVTVVAPALAPVAITATSHATSVVEMASSSTTFYDMVRGRIENNLKKNQIHKDLDLNRKQW